MSRIHVFMARRAGTLGAVAAVVLYVAVGAQGQSPAANEDQVSGRIDFADVELPPPAVEVDLSQGMFRDLFVLGDAAVAGVAESLVQSAEKSDGAEGTRLAAEQLAVARQIMQLASEVVREVRIRAYRNLSDEFAKPEALAAQFDEQLRAGNWDNVIRVRDENQSVRVSLLRQEGAVRGIFIVAGNQGKEVVLANVVCDVSPENVKKLSTAAATIGLENGLAPVIEMKMRELKHRPTPAPPRPPQPDRPESRP